MISSIEDSRRIAGQRSIADKIIKRLHDLEKTVEHNQGRWAWELLQNAKDSIAEDESKTVSIQIELDENSVTFRHNGSHFCAEDIVGIIEQISSKEVEESYQTKKTGRFGTGFLTTHLLSKVIKISGVLRSEDNVFQKFEFVLDRRGKTTTQLIPRIKKTWEEFNHSTIELGSTYDSNQFNTSFSYQLDAEEQKKVALIGIEEFSKLIPFVLAFIPRIDSVEIANKVSRKNVSFRKREDISSNSIINISKTENGIEEDVLLLYSSSQDVAIATEIEECERGYRVKGSSGLPKIFCDFPLIGTEDFHFPVIVNSFFFNPQTERDGIWLKGENDPEVEENRRLLRTAVSLYKNLVSTISENNFFDLYNMAETRLPSVSSGSFDEAWYKKFIQEPLRELLFTEKIVEMEDEGFEKKAIKELLFPKFSLNILAKESLWKFILELAPHRACKGIHLHSWCNVSWKGWKEVDYKNFVNAIEKRENLQKLSEALGEEKHIALKWLDSFGYFLLKEDEDYIALFEKALFTPNKNGQFRKKIDLYTDEIQDDELLYILKLIGEDWKDILLHENILFIRDYIKSKSKRDIAFKITENLKRLRKQSSSSMNEDSIKAIVLLSEWLEKNSEQAKELFSEIYYKRAEIFMDTVKDKDSLYKVMRSGIDLSKLAEAIETDSTIVEKIQEAEEINGLLEEFKAENLSDLKNMLVIAQGVLSDDSNKIEITQEVLISLGVTSIEELEGALEDKNISAKFVHSSTPEVEMFVAVQEKIKRAKSNVIRHLRSLKDYDCTDLEELATTVIGGIKKDGLPIYIVVRPSDNKEVIIYYSSEKDTLDDPSSELWIENGSDQPKRLTLGTVLKTTGITRIPIS